MRKFLKGLQRVTRFFGDIRNGLLLLMLVALVCLFVHDDGTEEKISAWAAMWAAMVGGAVLADAIARIRRAEIRTLRLIERMERERNAALTEMLEARRQESDEGATGR